MSGEERCKHCDRVCATQTDYDACPEDCTCARCISLCWSAWAPQCEHPPKDWREEALALRSSLAASERETAERIAAWLENRGPCSEFDNVDAVVADVRAGRWKERG